MRQRGLEGVWSDEGRAVLTKNEKIIIEVKMG